MNVLTGVTIRLCSTLFATVTFVVPFTPLKVAVIVVVPALSALTIPDGSTLATLAGAEVHVTVEVRS